MSNSLKPGVLALIVGAKQLTENIGKSCELVQLVQPGERFRTPDGMRTMLPENYPPLWLVEGEGIVGMRACGGMMLRTKGYGLCLPGYLVPLKGDGGDDESFARELWREALQEQRA